MSRRKDNVDLFRWCLSLKTQLGDYKLIQSQILLIEIISILWPTLGRIANEILRVKGLKYKRIARTWNYQPFTCDNWLLSMSNWSEFWPFKQTAWLENHNPLISLSDMHLRLLSQWDQKVPREKRLLSGSTRAILGKLCKHAKKQSLIALGPCDFIYKASLDTTNALHKKQRRNGK